MSDKLKGSNVYLTTKDKETILKLMDCFGLAYDHNAEFASAMDELQKKIKKD